MAKRQITQPLAVFIDREDMLNSHHITEDIPVAQHDAFREAGRSGGIDQGGKAIGGNTCLHSFNFFRPGICFSQFDQVVELLCTIGRFKGINSLDCSNPGQDVFDLAHDLLPGNKYEFNFRMGQDVLVIRFTDSGIDRDVHGANLQDAHIEEVPFRPVVGNSCDLISRPDSKLAAIHN